jgi:hypothetical protein
MKQAARSSCGRSAARNLLVSNGVDSENELKRNELKRPDVCISLKTNAPRSCAF